MEQKLNPELKPQVEFPNIPGQEAAETTEHVLPKQENSSGIENVEQEGITSEVLDSSSVVTEAQPVEAQQTLSEEQLEEEITEDLIHKSLDEITSANEAVEALMNKETPPDNLNALM